MMKRHVACALLLPLMVAVAGCGKKDNSGELPVIDVVGNAEAEAYRKIPASELISEFEYIPLETTSRSLVANTGNVIVTDSLIFVGGDDGVFSFTREGKFLTRIGRKGRGPGEWIHLIHMSIDDAEEIIYFDTYEELLAYTYNGKFVRSITKPTFGEREEEMYHFRNVSFLRDNLFIGCVDDYYGPKAHYWSLIDGNGDIVKMFDNHVTGYRRYGRSYVIEPSVIVSDNALYVKEGMNDTIFVASRDNELVPKFVFDLGRYGLPEDGDYTGGNSYEIMQKSIIVSARNISGGYVEMCISPNYIFFALRIGTRTGIKTPVGNKHIIPNGLGNEWYDSENVLGIYDISSGKTELLDRDSPSRRYGLVNDIDGGVPFFPNAYNAPANELVQVWGAIDVKGVLTEEHFAAHPARDPAAHARLRTLVENLKEDDNPVIMVAKLKKQPDRYGNTKE